jgi:hypothetical protein
LNPIDGKIEAKANFRASNGVQKRSFSQIAQPRNIPEGDQKVGIKAVYMLRQNADGLARPLWAAPDGYAGKRREGALGPPTKHSDIIAQGRETATDLAADNSEATWSMRGIGKPKNSDLG